MSATTAKRVPSPSTSARLPKSSVHIASVQLTPTDMRLNGKGNLSLISTNQFCPQNLVMPDTQNSEAKNKRSPSWGRNCPSQLSPWVSLQAIGISVFMLSLLSHLRIEIGFMFSELNGGYGSRHPKK